MHDYYATKEDVQQLAKSIEELQDTILRMKRDYDDKLSNIDLEDLSYRLRTAIRNIM